MITIKSKDVGEVKDVFRKECEVSQEHMHEQDYIKREFGEDE